MSSELERRLEGLLSSAPEPEPEVGEAALHRAVAALRPVSSPRRGLRAAVLVFAAAVVLLAVAAGSLAAAGALHVSFGAKKKTRPVTTPLTLPRGANGIAAIVDGRLSVVTKGGFRLQGLPASAAALSPHALYVAVGIGRSLVAMAPNGRRAWSHPVRGSVRAIAWAPDGLRIAYVAGGALHVIYGDGTHDTRIDASVRPVTPSWRTDSLAVAYVGSGGRAIVYDLAHESRRIVASGAPVTHLAFAPRGSRLAYGTPGGVRLLHDGRTRSLSSGDIVAFGWLRGRLRSFRSPSRVVAVSGRFVVTWKGRQLAAGHQILLRARPGVRVTDLQIG